MATDYAPSPSLGIISRQKRNKQSDNNPKNERQQKRVTSDNPFPPSESPDQQQHHNITINELTSCTALF